MTDGYVARKRNSSFEYRYIKEIITKNTTWTMPNNIKDNKLYITTVGGGGAGIQPSDPVCAFYGRRLHSTFNPWWSTYYTGQLFTSYEGGGGGYITSSNVILSPKISVPIIIGLGGTPFAYSEYFSGTTVRYDIINGTHGTSTSFGTHVIANGGKSATSFDSPGTGFTNGGENSTFTIYDVKNNTTKTITKHRGNSSTLYYDRVSGTIPSVYGSNSISRTEEFSITGYGGGASYGPGGDAGKNGINGSGGGGGQQGGGYGGNGLCIIEYYIKL